MTDVLRVERLRRAHHLGELEVVILDDVSFTLPRGSFTVLTGPSGSGKSTLLTLLAGWDHPTSGTLHWAAGLNPDRWDDVAVVPQALGLLDALTLLDNVTLPLQLHRAEREGAEARARAALESLEVGHLADRYPREASLGEQQCAALARALVVGPTLLLLDEPTAHLDQARTALVVDVLQRHAASGGTVLAASHDDLVRAKVHRELALDDGRLLAG